MIGEVVLKYVYAILNQACEKNKHRDIEIMQGISGEKEHAESVLLWVRKLSKYPSLELQSAAVLHDIDRIVTPGVGGGFEGDRNSKAYEEHKKAHAKRSADYVCPLLLEKGILPVFVDRVGFLIMHHDDTGIEIENHDDRDLDILVASDSLAFFTSISPRLYAVEGEKRTKDKIRFMINKMPQFARNLLRQQQLENKTFEHMKNEVLAEFR